MTLTWLLAFPPSADQGEGRAFERHPRPSPGTAADISDQALIRRMQADDVEAFTIVFRTYYVPLTNFVRRYCDVPSDAEDIAQDTLAALWERRQSVSLAGSLRALLYTSARNRAVDHHRHQRRAMDHVQYVQTQQGQDSTPAKQAADADLLAAELDHVMAKHVAALPARQREIFQLSRGEGLSPAEIASILGVTTSTVYVQLGRITKTLYEALKGWTQKR